MPLGPRRFGRVALNSYLSKNGLRATFDLNDASALANPWLTNRLATAAAPLSSPVLGERDDARFWKVRRDQPRNDRDNR
jgi:hypothetical protein